LFSFFCLFFVSFFTFLICDLWFVATMNNDPSYSVCLLSLCRFYICSILLQIYMFILHSTFRSCCQTNFGILFDLFRNNPSLIFCRVCIKYLSRDCLIWYVFWSCESIRVELHEWWSLCLCLCLCLIWSLYSCYNTWIYIFWMRQRNMCRDILQYSTFDLLFSTQPNLWLLLFGVFELFLIGTSVYTKI